METIQAAYYYNACVIFYLSVRLPALDCRAEDRIHVLTELAAHIWNIMKTCIRLFWNAVLFAALATVGFRSPAQTQNFSWTVTGTGTETWDTTIYHAVTASTATTKGTEGIPTQEKDYTAGMTGQASYSYSIGISSFWWANGSDGPADVSVAIDVGSSAIFQDSTDVPKASRGSSGTFNVSAGTSYRLLSSTYDPFGQGGWAWVTVNFPSGQQPNTATRTGTATGNNFVGPSDGQKNLYGFAPSAIPQPQNGGTMSGISYSLTWNNPNVALVFSDTWTTTTANPNAYIIAIWLPSVQGLSVVQTNLNSIVFEISPSPSTNYSIGGYCVGNGVTNHFGTGPAPVYFAGESLRPNTSYTFYIYEWDLVYGVSGPVLVTNVSTLPVPTPVITSLTPGLTNALLICTNVLPDGGTCWMIMTNGVSIPSLAGCTGSNSATNASQPFYFGIGYGSVPGVSCFKPGTVYTAVLWAWLDGMSSAYVTNIFTTLPMPVVPGNIVIVPTASNAMGSCTVVLGESVGYQIMENGTNVPGLANGTGLDIPYVNPLHFGIGLWATPLQPNTTYQAVVWGWSDGITTASTTNTFTTCPATPVITRIVPGITNALVTCTGILSGGSAGIWIYTNGVQIPSLCTGTSIISTTNPCNPITFGIGNGSVPGVTCFEPGTTYQVVIASQLDGLYSTGVTNSFTTLEPPGYNALTGQLLSGGKMRLVFSGNAGGNYVLEQSSSLTPANWNPLTTNPADSLGMLILTNTVNGSSNGFWRIRAIQ